MKKFLLKNRCNEIINVVETTDIESVILFFSKIKKLTVDKLLEIYQIKEK
jgi:hypothetical protein